MGMSSASSVNLTSLSAAQEIRAKQIITRLLDIREGDMSIGRLEFKAELIGYDPQTELRDAFIKFLTNIPAEVQSLGLEAALEPNYVKQTLTTFHDFHKRQNGSYPANYQMEDFFTGIAECFHEATDPTQKKSPFEVEQKNTPIKDVYGYNHANSGIELFVRSVSMFGNVSYRSSNHKMRDVWYYKFFLTEESAAASQRNDAIDNRVLNAFRRANNELDDVRSAKKHAALVSELLAYIVPNYQGFVKFLMVNDLESQAIKALFIEHDIEVVSFFDDKTKSAITIETARNIAEDFMSKDEALFRRYKVAFSQQN